MNALIGYGLPHDHSVPVWVLSSRVMTSRAPAGSLSAGVVF
ncbi:hypothetical protein [Fulvimarina sp. MAC8]